MASMRGASSTGRRSKKRVKIDGRRTNVGIAFCVGESFRLQPLDLIVARCQHRADITFPERLHS